MSKSSAKLPAPAPAPTGSIVTRHLEGNIVETRYDGNIVFDGSLNVELARFLEQYPGMHWLVDASGATGIDPNRRDNAGNTIQLFRKMGGGSIAAVIPSGPIRMVAAALSFGFDLKLKIFATRQEALTHLRTLPRT
jgi:hypothetical protein